MLFKGRVYGDASSGPILSQSVAIVLIVLIIGSSFYMWQRRQLRSRAAMVTIAGIVVILGFLAFGPGASP